MPIACLVIAPTAMPAKAVFNKPFKDTNLLSLLEALLEAFPKSRRASSSFFSPAAARVELLINLPLISMTRPALFTKYWPESPAFFIADS